MRIESVSITPSSPASAHGAERAVGDFGRAVKTALSEVNKLQCEADKLATALAAGEDVEIHQAMIAMQKASTALQFTVQVRNKIIEAYQEIMRMQV
ncbi:MAG: flagellar hook-basal body complex protein FliE [Armatimonadota bacterium]